MEQLDFTGAEIQDFTPMPPGSYKATVFEAEMTETKGDGALGVRPMLKIQFAIQEDGYENRRVFTNITIPPKELDGQPYKHYNSMMTNLKTFFGAVGYTKEEIDKWKKLPDLDELTGKACVVQLGISKYNPDYNEVKRVKPAAEDALSGGLAGL